MKYQKPEVVPIGTALTAIQSGLAKIDQQTDGTQPSVDAYQSDE